LAHTMCLDAAEGVISISQVQLEVRGCGNNSLRHLGFAGC
jgi:hypothetical protein